MKSTPVIIISLLLCAAAELAVAETLISGFRGDGSGRFPDATPPLTWSATEHVVWKAPMPNWSNSSPLLLGDLVVTCAETGSLIGVGANDGGIRWTYQDDPGRKLPKTQPVNGYTSNTPVSDGQRIFAVFGSGRAVACDLSGKKLWATELEEPPLGTKDYLSYGGISMSPRLAGGLLLVHIDHLWALDPATGAVKWKVEAPWTYGTPVVVKSSGGEMVWTGGTAFRVSDGAPAASGLPKQKYNSAYLFDRVLYCAQPNPMAFTFDADAKPKELWKGALAKGRYFASPLVHDGLLYAVNERGMLNVLDAGNGTPVYEQDLAQEGLKGTVYPSPTLGGKAIYIGSEGGQMLVIEPGRAFKKLALNELEKSRCSPVFNGKRVYLRGLKFLWCLGE